nr:unnamed protein product [Callosobruchus chinensis]
MINHKLTSTGTFPSSQENEESDNSESELEENEDINYFEELSESEPELECDIWDNDCKVIPKKPSSLIGRHLMPTCDRDPELHPKKKIRIAPEISRKLTSKDFMDSIKQNWLKNTNLVNESVELVVDPFKVCILKNFIDNCNFLDEVRREFYELDWNSRNMDLYEFFQSKDLKYLNSEYLKSVFDFLKSDVLKLVEELTGFNLTHISATCSIYTNTDYLLVHDDQREDRMVAFILYLTGEGGWDETKGGSLQLFGKDEFGQPKDVARNIYPANNQLVLFPVASDSYHQVAEVTSLSDCRMSINGWFHTKIPPKFEMPLFMPPEQGLYSNNTLRPKEVDIDLESWINEDYLGIKSIKLIQRHIEENSEISLHHFFKQESFREIQQTLKSRDTTWLKVGPPNRYCYEVLDANKLPHSLDRFLSLFQSTEMFQLLRKYTELELTSPNASMKYELQRWSPGSYSLLTDYNWQEKNELDIIIYFGCSKSTDIIGARTQYVTIEDEIQNALITLEPEENNLNIVYRDSARFTKYFSKQSKCRCFYTLICSYSE